MVTSQPFESAQVSPCTSSGVRRFRHDRIHRGQPQGWQDRRDHPVVRGSVGLARAGLGCSRVGWSCGGADLAAAAALASALSAASCATKGSAAAD